MKKRSFAQLALLGLTASLVHTAGLNGAATPSPKASPATTKSSTTEDSVDKEREIKNQENEGYHLMTEDELLMNLNAKSRALYETLDDEGKKLAREVASARCNGTNSCKGLNACKTDANECAGQGQCKGQGKCAFANKNLVVKLVAKKMAEKRGETLQKSKTSK